MLPAGDDLTTVLGRQHGGAGALGPAVAANTAHSLGRKHVRCVDYGQRNVVVDWREAADGTQEIHFKYWKLGAFPAKGEFYLLVYDDPFMARLHEVWHVTVSSRLRKDVQATLGQASPLDLVVRGDRHVRRVRAHASNELELEFNPSDVFKLEAQNYNQFKVFWRPQGLPGTRKAHVHLVDEDTHELLCAWLVTCVAAPPQITKEYDVDVRVGQPAHKKISFMNPWDRRRIFKLRSTEPNILRAKGEDLRIEPRGTGFIRLYLTPLERRGTVSVYLMVNDDMDQNEECFKINIRAEL